jgi:alkaline phosphatase D
MLRAAAALVAATVGAAALLAPPPDGALAPRIIAFGSCSKQFEPQPIWAAIDGALRAGSGAAGGHSAIVSSAAARAPANGTLFAWLGDIVYADVPIFLKHRRPATLEEIRVAYADQLARRDFAAFAAAHPIAGVPDDHDYGRNDIDRGN